MEHDREKFVTIIENLGYRWIVTGSFLVNQQTAKDIDIVIKWNVDIHDKLIAMGAENTNIKGYKGRAKTLESTWRFGDYNILVVKDDIAYALWQAFSNVIAHEEYAFVEKSDRIKLADFILGAYKTPLTATKKMEINFDA